MLIAHIATSFSYGNNINTKAVNKFNSEITKENNRIIYKFNSDDTEGINKIKKMYNQRDITIIVISDGDTTIIIVIVRP